MEADDPLLYFFVCFFIQGILEFNSASTYGFFCSAEAKGDEFGRMEEHPWPSSLGGLQGVPGAAAQEAEQ